MSNSLVDLSLLMSTITTKIIEAGGELTPELEAMFDDVGLQLEQKVDSYSFFMERLELEAEYWKVKADQLARFSRTHQNLKDRLNERIKASMVLMGVDEVKGQDVRFKLSKAAPRLLLEELILEDKYKIVKTETVPDKERIKADLIGGGEIKGARLVESFSLRKYLNKKS